MARFRGTKQFMNLVEVLTEEVEDDVKELVKETTLAVENDAKNLAPVDTGYLRRNIRGRLQSDFMGVVTSNAEYALYVEFGTSKTPAQPYFFPSYERNMKEFIKKLEDIAEKG